MKSLSVLLLSSVLAGCGTVSLGYQAGDGNLCKAQGSGLLGASYANAQFERCVARHPTAAKSDAKEP